MPRPPGTGTTVGTADRTIVRERTVTRVRIVDELRRLDRRQRLALAWDLFMVWVALLNLWLILFDLTYLWLRPVYLRVVPPVVRLYDPVKGIEPHPLTEEFLQVIRETRTLVRRDPQAPGIPEKVRLLRELTLRILVENPFERSGQEASHDAFLEDVARYAGVTADALRNPDHLRDAVRTMWPDDPRELRYRLDHLDPRLITALRTNYYRGFDRSGRLVDHFWRLDLPFLLVFWFEFVVRWIISVRRRQYARWYFFPIFNWYDVLGLLPTAYFRLFRLLRLVSVYMRLRRSELTSVGKGIFTRVVEYFSGILTEEVSDRVALRILSELEEEIADGTHVLIARSVVLPRLGEIEDVLVREISDLLTAETTLERFRELVRLNLETAIESSESLRSVPLPKAVVRPVVRTVGEVVVDATLETVSATLRSPEGQEALRRVVGSVVEEIVGGPVLGEAEALGREIAIGVIDRMKDVVAIKKWALPEGQERRSPFPWEIDRPAEEDRGPAGSGSG